MSGPKITLDDIEANIASEHFFTADEGVYGAESNPFELRHKSGVKLGDFPLHSLTFCVLVLKNGFTVTGESACVSPENFDAGVGRMVARDNAIEKCWPLMGYALKEELAKGGAA